MSALAMAARKKQRRPNTRRTRKRAKWHFIIKGGPTTARDGGRDRYGDRDRTSDSCRGGKEMGIGRDRDRQIDGAGWWGGVTHRESRTILCALKDNLHFTFQFLVCLFMHVCVCVCVGQTIEPSVSVCVGLCVCVCGMTKQNFPINFD